jgi:outer membrane protein assembly factor BamD (BamD/ComL family)
MNYTACGGRGIFRRASIAAGIFTLELGAMAAGQMVPAVLPTPAETAAAGPVPYPVAGPDAGAAAVTAEWAASAGRDALRAGLPDLAQGLFRQALATPGIDAGTRDALNLDLATAWLALDQVGNATAALAAVGAKDSGPYALRAALLAARSERWPEAAALLARVSAGGLPAADRSWYYLVQALLAEQAKDAAAAQAAWQQAGDAAATPLQKAQFEAAQWRSQMMLTGEATPELEATLAQQAKDFKNQAVGVEFAKEDAIVLDKLGQQAAALGQQATALAQHNAAVAVVTKLLDEMPDEDSDSKDSVRLLLALLDPDSAQNQSQLEAVLNRQHVALSQEELLTQEIALALLEQSLDQNPQGLQVVLGNLTTSQPNHPLLDRIYLLRAQVALNQGNLTDAQDSAQKLLDQFPGSPEHQDAWRLQAEIAWHSDPPRYRDAANYLHLLWMELPDGPERTRLAGLLADSYYLSGDYPEAAESYTALLGAPNPSGVRGALLLRAVQSDILAGQLDAALRLEETAAGGIAPLDRWPAEWNLLSALRENGREADAFKHLDQLLALDKTTPALPEELRLRLRWMAARLAVDVADPSATDRAKALQAEVEAVPAEGAPGVDQALRDQLDAEALLLLGQAAYLPGQTADHEQIFLNLQKEFPNSDEAIYSMYFEALELAKAGQTADAQNLMNDLVAEYPQSEYAPLALYESALYAEARGPQGPLLASQPGGVADQYQDALATLAAFVKKYPDHPLLFQVRLRQGDLERKNNNFLAALTIYNLLLHDQPNNPDAPRAELDKADCLVVLSSQDPAYRDEAESVLEHLLSLESLPVDARVEAGFKLGDMLARSQSPDDAAQAYYRVISQFLNNATLANELGPQGRYWMAKCLFELANLYEQKNQFETARQLYQQVLDHDLPGQALAAARMSIRPTPASPATPAS